MQTVQKGAYALIVIVIAIIVAFLGYAIEINFLRFQKQIELEKLLGAPYWKIVSSFLLYVLSTLVASFALVGVFV
jgi:cell division protein FtsX